MHRSAPGATGAGADEGALAWNPLKSASVSKKFAMAHDGEKECAECRVECARGPGATKQAA